MESIPPRGDPRVPESAKRELGRTCRTFYRTGLRYPSKIAVLANPQQTAWLIPRMAENGPAYRLKSIAAASIIRGMTHPGPSCWRSCSEGSGRLSHLSFNQSSFMAEAFDPYYKWLGI